MVDMSPNDAIDTEISMLQSIFRVLIILFFLSFSQALFFISF